jgi:hypothetical protein
MVGTVRAYIGVHVSDVRDVVDHRLGEARIARGPPRRRGGENARSQKLKLQL